MGTRLKALLAQNKVVRVFAVGQLCHPKIVEIVGLQGGYDAVWLDQEHVGLTMPQAAKALGISLRNAERNWTYAKTWLRRELAKAPPGDPGRHTHS